MYVNKLTGNFNPKVNIMPSSSTSDKVEAPNSSTIKSESSKLTTNYSDLSDNEKQTVDELKQIDLEVKNHEMAHVAAGGAYVRRGANFNYTKGPDGQLYAIGGDVLLDTSAISGNPSATMRKMDVIRSAALAPATPSATDRSVASKASSAKQKAEEELIKLQFHTGSDNNSKIKAESNYKNTDNNESKGSIINISG